MLQKREVTGGLGSTLIFESLAGCQYSLMITRTQFMKITHFELVEPGGTYFPMFPLPQARARERVLHFGGDPTIAEVRCFA